MYYLPFTTEKKLIELNDHLLVADWESTMTCDDPQLAYSSMFDTFTNIFNEQMPIAKIKHKEHKHNKLWLTKGILTSIRYKNKLYSQTLSNSQQIDQYRKYKNKLNHIMRIAEKQYYKNLLDTNKNDLKKTWKILNKIINKNKKATFQSRFKKGDTYLTEPEDIANGFNNYFANIGKSLAEKIPRQNGSPLDNMKGTFPNSVFLNPASETEISNIINKLTSTATGWDGINSTILKAV